MLKCVRALDVLLGTAAIVAVIGAAVCVSALVGWLVVFLSGYFGVDLIRDRVRWVKASDLPFDFTGVNIDIFASLAVEGVFAFVFILFALLLLLLFWEAWFAFASYCGGRIRKCFEKTLRWRTDV